VTAQHEHICARSVSHNCKGANSAAAATITLVVDAGGFLRRIGSGIGPAPPDIHMPYSDTLTNAATRNSQSHHNVAAAACSHTSQHKYACVDGCPSETRRRVIRHKLCSCCRARHFPPRHSLTSSLLSSSQAPIMATAKCLPSATHRSAKERRRYTANGGHPRRRKHNNRP